jgi:hypothetical protein
MLCPVRHQLDATYHAAVDEYVIAVNGMRNVYSPSFPRFVNDVDRSRIACERALIALRRHMLEHGCGNGTIAAEKAAGNEI